MVIRAELARRLVHAWHGSRRVAPVSTKSWWPRESFDSGEMVAGKSVYVCDDIVGLMRLSGNIVSPMSVLLSSGQVPNRWVEGFVC